MASSIALKRIISSNLLSPSLLLRQLAPVRAVAQPLSSRLFNSHAARQFESDICEYLDSPYPYGRRAFDPFLRRQNQIMNVMDKSESGTNCCNYDAWEKEDGLHLRMDMPGVDKKDVKVSVEQNVLVIKGEGEKESEDDDQGTRKYTSSALLPEKLYKISEIEAEMKNGVLKVFIPKKKEESRTNVFNVRIK